MQAFHWSSPVRRLHADGSVALNKLDPSLMLDSDVTYCQVTGSSPTTPLELMSTVMGRRLAEHVTPVQVGEQGSEPEAQLLRPEGQELAERRMPYMAVLATGGGGGGEGGRGGGEGGKGQGDPIPISLASTTDAFQGAGIAPQSPTFPGPRVRAFMMPIVKAHA